MTRNEIINKINALDTIAKLALNADREDIVRKCYRERQALMRVLNTHDAKVSRARMNHEQHLRFMQQAQRDNDLFMQQVNQNMFQQQIHQQQAFVNQCMNNMNNF